MVKFVLILLIQIGYSTTNVISQNIEDNHSIGRSYFGIYHAYKWIGEDISELTENEANLFLKKVMVIDQNVFVLFNDTVRVPSYQFLQEPKDDFFSDYTVHKHLIDNLPDTLTVLSVNRGINENRKIIILSKELVVNYRGCFYFFRRNRSSGKRMLRQVRSNS